MNGTYVKMQPLSEEKSGIRRLGSHGGERAPAATNSGINIDGIAFAFRGAPDNQSEPEKNRYMRLALEEVYAEFIGRKANDNDDSAELKKQILAHYRDSRGDPNAKLVLTIVSIDPANKSASFADALDKLETFTTQSKHALVLDTYHHLATLDDTKADERDRLCDSIVHLLNRGAFQYSQLQDDDKQWLGDLVNQRPHIRKAIAGAEERYKTQRKALERQDVHEAFKKGNEAIASSAKASIGNTSSAKTSIGNLPEHGSVKKLGAARQVALPDDKAASTPAGDVGMKNMNKKPSPSAARAALIEAASLASIVPIYL